MNASNPASYSLFTLWREIMSLFEATGHIGLPYLYLGCGFAKKPYFFIFLLIFFVMLRAPLLIISFFEDLPVLPYR